VYHHGADCHQSSKFIGETELKGQLRAYAKKSLSKTCIVRRSPDVLCSEAHTDSGARENQT